MKRDYFMNLTKLKKAWLDAVAEVTMDFSEEYREEMSKEFNELYNEHFVRVYNTATGKESVAPALKFLNYISNNAILIEDGSLFLSHDILESPICKILLSFITGRKVYKGMKLNSEENSDAISAAVFGVIELIVKLVVNTYYGMSIYSSSPFYNISVGSACTCKGRTGISVAALTSELIGGWRPYILDAHLKLIEKVKEEALKNPDLGVTLRVVSVDETLKAMLGSLYETYLHKPILRGILEKLPKDVLSRIYHKNDVPEFLDIPEVDAVIRKLYTKLNDPNIKFMNVRKYSKEIKEEVELLTKYIQQVLFGMYHYGGDVVNGKKYNNTILTVKKMIRRRVVIIDTDSACPTMVHEMDEIDSRFKDIKPKHREGDLYATITIATLLYTTCVTQALNNYSGMCNIPDRFHKYIVMEDELVCEHTHISRAMKNYAGRQILKEGFDSVKIMSKGFGYKKTNFQPAMAKAAKTIVEKTIMVELNDIDTKKAFIETKSKTEEFINKYQNTKGLITMADVQKMNAPIDSFAFGEARRKALTLHNRLFPEHQITVPGVFRSIPLMLSLEVQEKIKKAVPQMYEVINQYALECTMYKNYNKFATIFNLVYGVAEEGMVVHKKKEIVFSNILIDKKSKLSVFTENEWRVGVLQSSLYRKFSDISDFSLERYNSLIAELGKTEFGRKLLEHVKVEKFNGEKTIMKTFKTCALPIDVEEVNSFFVNNQYSIINTGKAALVEMLVSPLIDGLSIIGTRNKDNRVSITNIIDSF